MRTIKFRIWDKKENDFIVAGILITITGGLINSKLEYVDEKRLIIQQFTGLLDKNGKEVFEGDIVKAKTENTDLIWEVEWGEVDCAFILARNKQREAVYFPAINHAEKGIEIIGNVWENPELLNQ